MGRHEENPTTYRVMISFMCDDFVQMVMMSYKCTPQSLKSSVAEGVSV